eukprot:TRINITY_DN19722_c0_g1_i9.p1 TRINITY_DN19722_c0_g1~~TRINITY_DN19722_c0_g1_i9.p1  ORF type:complete len:181 (+),score=18.60 TRINITY_DN19722_c0_g1_i9:617-1159(+)
MLQRRSIGNKWETSLCLSPTDARKNSSEYWRAKFEQEHKARLELLEIPWTPSEAGLQTVPTQSKKTFKRLAHKSDNPHGSFRVNNKLQKKRDRQQLEADERARIDQKRLESALDKEAKAKEYQELVDKFDGCGGGQACQCDATTCPMLKYKKCPTCGDIKLRLCTKSACKDARAVQTQPE